MYNVNNTLERNTMSTQNTTHVEPVVVSGFDEFFQISQVNFEEVKRETFMRYKAEKYGWSVPSLRETA